MRKILFFFSIVWFLGGFSFSLAHLTGASWEKVVNGYKVDVGYDPVKFAAGESQRFDFNIYEEKTGSTANFSDVWVRISQGEQTVFAGGIHKPDFGPTGMIFTFPKEGDYVVNVRFENADKSLAQAEFPVAVGPAARAEKTFSPPWQILLAPAFGLVLGVWAVLMFKKSKKGSHE